MCRGDIQVGVHDSVWDFRASPAALGGPALLDPIREVGMDRFEKRRMDGAEFRQVSLGGARFDDVNLAGASFTNVNLSGTRLENVNLSGVSIENANIAGLRIFGYDVAAWIKEQLDRDCGGH
jgi:uncharacterized protein YjbI with pentapeptide repeats